MARNLEFAFPGHFTGDEKSIELIEMLVRETPNPFSRHQFTPGHVTATGLVLHPDGMGVAMVMHARLKRWLLPGGHVEEGDKCVVAAAAREVFEEAGLCVEWGEIIGADVHGITAMVKAGVEVEPYHLHHDVLVWFRSENVDLVLSDESNDVKWVWPVEFDLYGVPQNVRRAYARIRR